MRLLFPLFVLLPIIEIYVLLKVGGLIGPLSTIAVILLTAVIGYRLFRAQGLEKLQKMRDTMNGSIQGQSFAMDIAEGAAILIAGVLLLTPGFVTDAFGFACLIPPVRQIMIKKIMARSVVQMHSNVHYQARNHTNQATPGNSKQTTIIEGEYIDKK